MEGTQILLKVLSNILSLSQLEIPKLASPASSNATVKVDSFKNTLLLSVSTMELRR